MHRRDAKAAATRARLIDATFDCLVSEGYHGTSTVAVCRRAGVARGTMLHHFPNKRALVLAAIEDVLGRRAAAFEQEFIGADVGDVGGLVRHLWAAVRGPTFTAWLELAVASRTDPVLDAEFRAVMARFDALVTNVAQAIVPPEAAGHHDLELTVSLVFSALNGIALDLLQVDPERVEAKVDLLVTWLAEVQAPSAG